MKRKLTNINGWWWVQPKPYDRQPIEARTEVDLLVLHVPQKRVVVQAGGCVGWWPFLLADHFETVYTFEAEESNYEAIKKNCANKPNVKPYYAALGDKVGTLQVRTDMAFTRHQVDEKSIGVSVSVPSQTIDNLHLAVCDLIFLDVEGYEPMALKGSENTLRTLRPVLAVELAGHSQRLGIADEDTIKWVTSLGYVDTGISFGHKNKLFKPL